MITHAVIFAPIGQASRSDQIVQRLSNAIITGLLEANEQLPNEADLAKMMGVSHITIREALNTLRANNLIHTVRGRNGGSFVCEQVWELSQTLNPFKSLSTDYLSDLGEMHCALVAILFRSDNIHREIVELYTTLIDTLASHNEAESVNLAKKLIDTFTFYLIENKLQNNIK